jgi:hypothetical protein
MDTEYADAVNRLTDEVESACVRAEGTLSAKEIARELHRIANEIEDEA